MLLTQIAMKKNAICLLSGGLDSTTALLFSKKMGFQIKAVNFNYYQRSRVKEQRHAKAIARYFDIPFFSIEFPFYKKFKIKNALLNKNLSLPTPNFKELTNKKSFKNALAVWVPNRNGTFIEIAALIAESWNISNIIVGFNKEEARTFPDNSEEYLEVINKALAFSTRNKVKVISPTLQMTKVQMVSYLLNSNFPLKLLWSCYGNGNKMCGKCESCMRLKNALLKNGVSVNEYFKN